MPFNDFVSRTLSDQEVQNNPWLGSPNEKFKFLPTPQAKGKVGVLAYQDFLEKLGIETRLVNDQGDIEFKDPDSGTWVKDEVKTASATMVFRKKDEQYTTKHWFNQIRPRQEAWQGVTLVAVFPSNYKIYRMKRDDYLNRRVAGGAGITPGHTGTDELDQVLLVDNSRYNSYNDWELIYEGE